MGNVKISELPYASRIDDDALVVLVQDHANKVVTVDELSQKINEKQNHTIDHLWHELRRVTGLDTVKALSNTAANHEYRIDNIEKFISKDIPEKNKKQDCQLVNLTNALKEVTLRQHSHCDDIRLLQFGLRKNRCLLAYVNTRVDKLIGDCGSNTYTISKLQTDLTAATEKHEADLAYTYGYIKEAAETTQSNCYAYTAKEVDNNWTYTYSTYAYLSGFVHFSPSEYWGSITNVSDIYKETLHDNVSGTIKKDESSTTKGCIEGCTC